MAELDGFEEALIEYIRAEVNPKVRIDADTELLATEVLDSVGLFAVIGFVEDRFGLDIAEKDLSIDNFRTVSAICQLVANKLSV